MKIPTIRLIVIVGSLSLLGIVFTQLLWFKNAIYLTDLQCNHRTIIALRSTIDKITLNRSDSVLYPLHKYSYSESNDIDSLTRIINPFTIDSLLRNEIERMNIENDYEYGIYNDNNKKLLFGNYVKNSNEIIKSEIKTSISNARYSTPLFLSIYFPNQQKTIFNKLSIWVLLSVLFLVIGAISFTVSVQSLLKQKRLTKIKTDFFNNMTHEFKTPISTISMASEMLLNPEILNHPLKVKKYVKVIFDENFRLSNQVEKILQISMIDQGEMVLKKRDVNIHKVLDMIVANKKMIIKQRKGKIVSTYKAENSIVFADMDHITTVFSNLIDNAEKFSPQNPHLRISTSNNEEKLIIIIQDHGIGIKSDDLDLIFKKFYRISNGDIHDVKGFGLGLYYVKEMVEKHGGKIQVSSELNKGTTFEITLPLAAYSKSN